MIIIDGTKTDLRIENFTNLEEILVVAARDQRLENRVVTDVLLNKEVFSELYPHQAEDIAASDIASVELRSMPFGEMALSMAQELFKVSQLMSNASRSIAKLFRQADNDEALEMLQDLLEVSRDFMSMIGVLRTEFLLSTDAEFSQNVEKLSALLGEMTEGLQNEDWILFADLLEYEFVPLCEEWKQVIQSLRDGIRTATEE